MAAPSDALAADLSIIRPTVTAPSPRMLRAALSGLMAAGAFGCTDSSDDNALTESSTQELSDEELKAACADMVADAKKEVEKASESKDSEKSEADLDALCEDRVKDAQNACEKPDVDEVCKDAVTTAVASVEKPDTKTVCADLVKEAEANAVKPKTADEKTISAEQKEYTFAELTKMCDSRGGYVQVHGSCGGVNSCRGFSYGDWGPGAAMLTEHSCSGANGCQGLSCALLAEGKYKDKSGAELYDQVFADTEPSSCSNCHAPHVDDVAQLDKFIVHVPPGSTRNASNWLERTPAEQERVIAFGVHTVLPDGTAMKNMAQYKDVLSRTEIERLVAHLRTLTPVIEAMKIKDPEAATSL